MKRGCYCLLLALAFLFLPASVRAQGTQGTNSSASQTNTAASQANTSAPQAVDEYAFRLTLFVVQKLEGNPNNPENESLVQAARELFAADKQEQLRKDLERRIGSPGNPKRPARYDALLTKIDLKLSDKKIGQLREDLAKKGRDSIARWPWPLCVIVGCK